MVSKHRLLMRVALLAMASAMLLASGCSLILVEQLKRGTGTGTGQEPGDDPGSNPPTDPGGGFAKYTCENDTVTVAWDAPASEVASYKLFYRQHETGTWTLVTEIPAQSDPSVTLNHADFGNGSYDFGVEAVAEGGAESPMHTSLDNTAQPTSGWYLIWNL
jgi:hypothetical protein